MKEMILTKSAVAIVDDEDYEKLKAHKWSLSVTGYAVRGFRRNGKSITIKMHREILGEQCEGFEVDHINGNKLDNRRANLRTATRSQNSSNRQKYYLNGTSKYKGVRKAKGRKKWTARIFANGKAIYLGQYETEEEAAMAYNKAAIQYHGQFANINTF